MINISWIDWNLMPNVENRPTVAYVHKINN